MPFPSLFDIARGDARGWSAADQFGRNAAVDTTLKPVAASGIWRTPQVSGAQRLRIKAGNANDTAAGSGARKVRIYGLDATGAAINEEVATNGATAGSLTTASFLRVFRAVVTESGSYGSQTVASHAAAIVIEDASGNEWARILDTTFGRSETQIGCYSVPLGYEMYIVGQVIAIEATKTASVLLFQRENILQTAAPYSAVRVVEEFSGIVGTFQHTHTTPLGPFPALTDVGYMASVTGQTGQVSVTFDYMLRRVS